MNVHDQFIFIALSTDASKVNYLKNSFMYSPLHFYILPFFIKVANFKKMLMQWDTQILTGINELLLL